jgi:hypothetical protein
MNQSLLDMETTYISAYGDYNITELGGNTFGYKHTEASLQVMRNNYSQARREAIGSLNRDKTLSPETIQLMREAAFARSPMSDETRAKLSTNSANAILIELSHVDGSLFPNGENTLVLHTINVVAQYCKCDERTVRRALKGNGILRRKWNIKSIGLSKNITNS